MVKTDANGKLLKSIDVASHHGDLCHYQGELFVAVNFGQFNHPDGMAENWIYIYDAATLEFSRRVAVPEVRHGAGGIAVHDGRFMVVGGLPEANEKNLVYEYGPDLKFRRRHEIDSGHTHLGIQTATYSAGKWWFGCYGNKLLRVDSELKFEGRFDFDCGYGIEALRDGHFLVASGHREETGYVGTLTQQTSVAFQQAARRPAIQRVLFGSCIKQQNPVPIFEQILAEKPEAFLFVGDNIYADTADMELMRMKYAVLGAMPGFRKLTESCHVLATWDDHDYGKNDGGAEFEVKRPAQRLFTDFWRDPVDSSRRQRPGLYEAYYFGDAPRRLQIIFLDTRYFRGPLKSGEKRTGGPYVPSDDPASSMLGDQQWQWLDQELDQPAELRLIVTSIQCIAEDDGQETWSNLPLQRRRFFELLTNKKARNVVLLSGDRHWSELSVSEDAGFPIYELTSSSLNQIHPRGTPTLNKFRAVATTFHKPNYGVIDIDWNGKTVHLAIADINGKRSIKKTVNFGN